MSKCFPEVDSALSIARVLLDSHSAKPRLSLKLKACETGRQRIAMSNQESDRGKKSHFVLKQLTCINEQITWLEKQKAELEDLILQHLFAQSASASTDRIVSNDFESVEFLPSRQSPVECAHYLAWTSRATPSALHDEAGTCSAHFDADGHLIAAKTELSFLHPMADVVTIVHPSIADEETVILLRKIADEIAREGVYSGLWRLHDGTRVGPCLVPADLGSKDSEPRQESLLDQTSQEAGENRLSAARPLIDALFEILTEVEDTIEEVIRSQEAVRLDVDHLRNEIESLTSQSSVKNASAALPFENDDQMKSFVEAVRREYSDSRQAIDSLRDELNQCKEYSNRTDRLSMQLTTQQSELAETREAVAEMTERLNRQADVIRAIYERESWQGTVSRQLQELLSLLRRN